MEPFGEIPKTGSSVPTQIPSDLPSTFLKDITESSTMPSALPMDENVSQVPSRLPQTTPEPFSGIPEIPKTEPSQPAFVPSSEPGFEFGNESVGDDSERELIDKLNDLIDSMEKLNDSLKDAKRTTEISEPGLKEDGKFVPMGRQKGGLRPVPVMPRNLGVRSILQEIKAHIHAS